MLQLGNLMVITWPRSRFKKKRIKGSNFICTQPVLRDVLRSYAQLIVRSGPDWVWHLILDVSVMVRILKFYFEEAIIFVIFFLSRICSNLFFGFRYPYFCLNCFFYDYSQRDAPIFLLSLLHRFWLNGLLFREIMIVCLDDYTDPSPSFVLEGRLRCHSLCMKWKIATECASELT